MAEFIERETALNLISDIFFKTDPDGEEQCGVIKCSKAIRNAPAADVVEVVHGEWKKGHYEGGLLDGVNFDKCNICGHERMIENVEYKTAYNYCPKCGAKMDGENNE